MGCSRYRQLISRYVDGEVTPRQRSELLAHVQVCADCAAWLARARQTDVLLKNVGDTGPSDRVRDAILGQIRAQHDATESPAPLPARSAPNPRAVTPMSKPKKQSRLHGLQLAASWLLLRFDFSPRRIVVGGVALVAALVGIAYWANLFQPLWGYNKLGFEYGPDSQAVVDSTPAPIPAVSSGLGGVGGTMSSPNLVRLAPASGATLVASDSPLLVRFDQPMDRASVEGALRIDPPAAGAFSWDADNEVRFTPAAPGLLRGVTYSLVLTGTARSLSGTPVSEPSYWSFSTKPAYRAAPGMDNASAISPADTLSLVFDVPMQPEGAEPAITLWDVAAGRSLPTAYKWDEERRWVAVIAGEPLQPGTLALRVGATARTASGETLGAAYEYTYTVGSASGPALRLAGGHIGFAQQGITLTVPYELDGVALPAGLALDIYALPAEMLPALAPSLREWPARLPEGFPANLNKVSAISSGTIKRADEVTVSPLPVGLYLIVAAASPGAPAASDWRVLVVADRNLTVTGSAPGLPLWATTREGDAWASAEVSLYSASGALVEKGLTGTQGLWTPAPGSLDRATLALALDTEGHIGAVSLQDAARASAATPDTLSATLVTDRPEYAPGSVVNFRVLVRASDGSSPATPVVEQQIGLFLLNPAGQTVSSLTLKPDSVGGVGGTFPIAEASPPGTYTIRVIAGGAQRTFLVSVVTPSAPSSSGLSVYVMPGQPPYQSGVITRTVSVLGVHGLPAVGAVVTGTLRIVGEPAGVSEPVTATVGPGGQALLRTAMPGWATLYTDSGLYLQVEARLAGKPALTGAGISYLDVATSLTEATPPAALVSPLLGVAAIAIPSPGDGIRVRIVSLDLAQAGGGVLAFATAPNGESAAYPLNMALLPDVTLSLPPTFEGGTLEMWPAAGDPERTAPVRTLSLTPANRGGGGLTLSVPATVPAGAPMTVSLTLSNSAGLPNEGIATVWMRRMSGVVPGDSSTQIAAWEPGATLDTAGNATTTLQAPNSPGLWYVIAEAATGSGVVSREYGVVRVLPGLWVQAPVAVDLQGSGVAGGTGARDVSVLVHNASNEPISTGMRAQAEGALALISAGSQAVDLPARGSRALVWRVTGMGEGSGRLVFSFMPSAGVAGDWRLVTYSTAAPHTDTTYTAGVLTGDRTVGVAVPSGLAPGNIRLEIRASTTLLGALSGAASSISFAPGSDGIPALAARLSGPGSVASAYARAGRAAPGGLTVSGPELSVLLQSLYAAQLPDGGWTDSLRPETGVLSDVRSTADVLAALKRMGTAQDVSVSGSGSVSGSVSGVTASLRPDDAVVARALDYLSTEMARPLPETRVALDDRAYALYVLSLYRSLPAEWARPLIAHAGGGSASSTGAALSRDGQALLALALWNSGNPADGAALLDRLISTRPSGGEVSVPVLEALLTASMGDNPRQTRFAARPDYATLAGEYAASLMEARQGAGWSTSRLTASALWALSRYATVVGDTPQTGVPSIMLGDRAVVAPAQPGDPGSISVALTGGELHAGTNQLKLSAPHSDGTLYYSLSLIATR